jgi:hypothetical protein
MQTRSLLVALALAPIVLAGCGSTQPAASSSSASIAPAATTSSSTSTTSTTSTTTSTSAPDGETVKVCRSMDNELGRNGLGDLLSEFAKTKSLLPISFATPLEKYSPVSAGAAVPAVGSAVNDFNDAVESMNGSMFTQWSQDQVTDLLTAYVNLVSGCLDVHVDLPWYL